MQPSVTGCFHRALIPEPSMLLLIIGGVRWYLLEVANMVWGEASFLPVVGFECHKGIEVSEKWLLLSKFSSWEWFSFHRHVLSKQILLGNLLSWRKAEGFPWPFLSHRESLVDGAKLAHCSCCVAEATQSEIWWGSDKYDPKSLVPIWQVHQHPGQTRRLAQVTSVPGSKFQCNLLYMSGKKILWSSKAELLFSISKKERAVFLKHPSNSMGLWPFFSFFKQLTTSHLGLFFLGESGRVGDWLVLTPKPENYSLN